MTLTVIAVLVAGLGTAHASRFIEPLEEPAAVAAGSDGSIYVCEALGHRVSVFDRTGARLGGWGSLGKGIGEFDGPRGIALSADGRVYVADTGNDRIQVFTAEGKFERQWGRHGSDSGEFDEPRGLAVLGDRVFVADSGNNRVQVFRPDGTFLLFVWNYGSHDGAFDRPVDVAVGRDGAFYVSDQGNSRIQKFSPEGRFVLAWGGRGRGGGLLEEPGGLAEREGHVIVADPYTERLVSFDRSGTLLGELSTSGDHESHGIDAPTDVSFLPQGDELVVCSEVEDRCQIVSTAPNSVPATAAGSRRIARDGYAVGGAGESIVVASRETGAPFILDLSRKAPAVVAKLGGPGREPGEFMRPTGFELDLRNGTVLVSDSGNLRLQRLTLGPNSKTTFIKGIGLDDEEKLVVEPGSWVLDPATVEPGAIARDSSGRLVIADTVGRRVVVLDRDFRLVDSWGGFGDGDGRFRKPVGLALDPAGSIVYVLDAGQRRVQAFDIDGRFRRAWGGSGEGPGEFTAPSGIATGKDGSVYVVDRGANRVQRFDRDGARLSAWGSTGSCPGQFRKPEAVHVDGRGRVIVIDSGNRRAQVFTVAGRFVSEFSLDPATMKATPIRGLRPARRATGHPGSPEVCRASIVSNGGRYRVCATTLPDPVPQNAPFAMNVAVYENSAHGALARNVILDVDATMPEHHHGMTLTPQVRAIDGPAVQELLPGHGAMGNGRFEVRGMLFHMPGRWEIHFDITHGAITERAQLDVELD